MRILAFAIAAVIAIGVLSAPRPAKAAPDGSYRSSCRNIRTDGPILSADCWAGLTWRSSRLNYRRCYGDIAVENGFLVCRGDNDYRRRDDDDGDQYGDRWRDRGGDRYDNDGDRGRYGGGLVLYAGPGFSGASMPIYRDVWNLDGTAFNDRSQSVRIDGGVWLLCQNANFGGRCITLSRSVGNLYQYGLGNEISSVRRVR